MDNKLSRDTELVRVIVPILEKRFSEIEIAFWIYRIIAIEDMTSSKFSVDEIIDILKYSVKLYFEEMTVKELSNCDALLLSYAAYVVYQLPDFDETSDYRLVKETTNDET
jgi:hypothetical protein